MTTTTNRRTLRNLLLSCGSVLLIGLAASPAAQAVTITSFGGSATDINGARLPQAGAHPDVTTELRIERAPEGNPVQNLESLFVDLPAGLVANPEAAPKCTIPDLGYGVIGGRCAVNAQVGTVRTYVGNGFDTYPLYNLEAPEGAPALLGFKVYGVVNRVVPSVRPGDYGITGGARGISQTLGVHGVSVTLWGVPSDPAHDAERAGVGLVVGTVDPQPSTAPRLPFVTAPTECSGRALVTRGTARSWEDPTPASAAFDSDLDGFPLISEGCDRLGFEPLTGVSASTPAADAPTGLTFDLESPQNLDNPGGLANAQLRDVSVALPEGLTVNPGSANGLEACSDAQLGLGSNRPVGCPAGSKLGTVTAQSPLLDELVEGDVILRSQNSDDPESGEMFRLALVLENKQRGLLIKLPGSAKADSDTGRITAEFKNNPQLPVENIKATLKSGPRAPLATPPACGSRPVQTNLVSWAGHNVDLANSIDIDCAPGLGGFAPTMLAGTADPAAGGFSPFTLSIAKPDGNSAIDGLRMELPKGLIAMLKGNLGSQVGSVKAFAGPGSAPFMLPGKVFLEGPYGDAPYSLRAVVPAKAGPFDLGEVVVRQKIYVDPIDAHVTVVSDPIPTIVKGVPVRLQRLDVNVDKPDFVINPTSCAPKTIEGVLKSVADQTAALSVRFRVGECASLDLKPALALSLSGKGQTTDGKHPAVTANLTQPAGQANLKKVRVALPLSLALDVHNANGLCEFVDGSKVTPTCPKSSIVGTATAVTPILNEPLSGPVYFVKNVRKNPKTGRDIKTLPKLVIPLVGENGLKLTLTGTSDVENDHLVTTFDNIPDAPVSSFKLSINGGKGGILAVSGADICKSTQIADQQVDGQNNKQADANVYIKTPSCPLKVLSKKVGKRSVTLEVGGLGAGKVTVTGKGIKKTSKSISKSTVATIVVRRTKGAPKQIKVSFLAKGAKKAKTARA